MKNYQGPVFEAFTKSNYLSIKHSNYFIIYDKLLNKFKSQDIIFVEVGVANGGSLFMWRNYFGKKARIIGIDNNPSALKWKNDFEIHIGDQANPLFWSDFFKKVGRIDILLDDGGHKNSQQIVTAVSCIPYIKNGGLLIVEDTHTSFWNNFGNPSKYSFFNFAVAKAANLTKRHKSIDVIDNLMSRVFKIEFFDSVVAFEINENNAKPGYAVSNGGIAMLGAPLQDVSINIIPKLMRKFIKKSSFKLKFLKRFKILKIIVKKFLYLYFRVESKIFEGNYKKYFY